MYINLHFSNQTPPQKSQLCQTGIGASNYVCVPVETKSKGIICLDRTLNAVSTLNNSKIINTQLLAVLPFRDRWFGHHRSVEGSKAVEQISARIHPDQLGLISLEKLMLPAKLIDDEIY